jgi:hypothetical protein
MAAHSSVAPLSPSASLSASASLSPSAPLSPPSMLLQPASAPAAPPAPIDCRNVRRPTPVVLVDPFRPSTDCESFSDMI